ncbi:hypothetical protein [Sphingobacterium suaedae]|uniref:Transcriptional regulator n=1 Tax=Sphingobacterium suaedae TaxID=1686402 RepID=A0ABW5KHN5_9SPHI
MELQGAKEPFDLEIGDTVYSVFPEEKDVFIVFKEGEEYVKIIRDTENAWLKLHPETELPLFGMDEEVNLIGQKINEELGNA